jgi:hypothetical protein
MDELIYSDMWDLYLRNGARISVHAQSLDVTLHPDGTIASISAVPWPGLATSLEAIAVSQVDAIVKRREQGTLKDAYRRAGKVEYIEAASDLTQAKK